MTAELPDLTIDPDGPEMTADSGSAIRTGDGAAKAQAQNTERTTKVFILNSSKRMIKVPEQSAPYILKAPATKSSKIQRVINRSSSYSSLNKKYYDIEQVYCKRFFVRAPKVRRRVVGIHMSTKGDVELQIAFKNNIFISG